ncbi:MAG TPA: universal stress protein [Gemmatales bacterium]|nr:universal stress protein [Gemmatales bacterium]
MYHIKTILHPTDETTTFTGAWKLAQLLAGDHGAELVVVHVIPLPVYAFSEVDVTLQQPLISPDEDLELLKKNYVAEAGIPVRHLVDQGDASTVLERIAQEQQASLIVMGTHGRKGLGRVIMGSVAEHIVRHAKCPVITVKSDWQPTS